MRKNKTNFFFDFALNTKKKDYFYYLLTQVERKYSIETFTHQEFVLN